MGEDDQAYYQEQLAKQIYDHYQKSYSDENRINLPPFDFSKYFAIRDFFSNPQYPDDLKKSLYNRINIEKPELAKKFKQIESQFLQQIQEQNTDK